MSRPDTGYCPIDDNDDDRVSLPVDSLCYQISSQAASTVPSDWLQQQQINAVKMQDHH